MHERYDMVLLVQATGMKRDYDFLFKLVLIGDSGVGKSCLLLRFAVRAIASIAFLVNASVAHSVSLAATAPKCLALLISAG